MLPSASSAILLLLCVPLSLTVTKYPSGVSTHNSRIYGSAQVSWTLYMGNILFPLGQSQPIDFCCCVSCALAGDMFLLVLMAVIFSGAGSFSILPFCGT